MKEGDVGLTLLPQADGKLKNRPVIFLHEMPPYRDWLVCRVSTQLHQEAHGFDERISPDDSDFTSSGLKSESLIRLGFLAGLPGSRILGSIGSVSSERHRRLLQTLCDHLLDAAS